MKRAGLAFLAGVQPKRLDQLRERGQLPFPDPGRFGAYRLSDAFQLRVMLMAVDGPAGGIGPADAATLIAHAAGKAAETYGPEPADLVGLDAAVWFGAVEFAGGARDGGFESWVGWYAGPLGGLGAFIAAQLADPMNEALRGAHAVRVLALVNATAAALDVITKAEDLEVRNA